MSQVDKSKYYRGLLVLTRTDRNIDPRERELMLRFGTLLDFDKRFCEASIDDVLENKHLNNDPVIFDDRVTAECFLRDAIRLALVDDSMNPDELAWIQSVAGANHVPTLWLDEEIRSYLDRKPSLDPAAALEIERCLP
jgi:hypothetical protein